MDLLILLIMDSILIKFQFKLKTFLLPTFKSVIKIQKGKLDELVIDFSNIYE